MKVDSNAKKIGKFGVFYFHASEYHRTTMFCQKSIFLGILEIYRSAHKKDDLISYFFMI